MLANLSNLAKGISLAKFMFPCSVCFSLGGILQESLSRKRLGNPLLRTD